MSSPRWLPVVILTTTLVGCGGLPPGGRVQPTFVPLSAPDGSVLVTVLDSGDHEGFSPHEEFVPGPFAILDPEDAGAVTIVTFGSSSCPATPVSFDPASTVLSVWAEYTGDSGFCTADMAPTAVTIATPDGYDPGNGMLLNGNEITVG